MCLRKKDKVSKPTNNNNHINTRDFIFPQELQQSKQHVINDIDEETVSKNQQERHHTIIYHHHVIVLLEN